MLRQSCIFRVPTQTVFPEPAPALATEVHLGLAYERGIFAFKVADTNVHMMRVSSSFLLHCFEFLGRSRVCSSCRLCRCLIGRLSDQCASLIYMFKTFKRWSSRHPLPNSGCVDVANHAHWNTFVPLPWSPRYAPILAVDAIAFVAVKRHALSIFEKVIDSDWCWIRPSYFLVLRSAVRLKEQAAEDIAARQPKNYHRCLLSVDAKCLSAHPTTTTRSRCTTVAWIRESRHCS